MGRDFYINGESLVKVKGGSHTQNTLSGNISMSTELGLSSDAIRVTPQFYYKDVRTDDYGPNVPVTVATHLADVIVRIPFIHYDPNILDSCLGESVGGITGGAFALPPMGTMMDGGGLALFASGNHFLSLNILSPVAGIPYRFLAGYLTGPPVEIPLGTEKTIAMTTWRFIPYQPPIQQMIDDLVPQYSPGNPDEIIGYKVDSRLIGYEFISSGAVLWDYQLNN